MLAQVDHCEDEAEAEEDAEGDAGDGALPNVF